MRTQADRYRSGREIQNPASGQRLPPFSPSDRELQVRVCSMDREKDLERESHFAKFLGKWLILFRFLHDL